MCGLEIVRVPEQVRVRLAHVAPDRQQVGHEDEPQRRPVQPAAVTNSVEGELGLYKIDGRAEPPGAPGGVTVARERHI